MQIMNAKHYIQTLLLYDITIYVLYCNVIEPRYVISKNMTY